MRLAVMIYTLLMATLLIAQEPPSAIHRIEQVPDFSQTIPSSRIPDLWAGEMPGHLTEGAQTLEEQKELIEYLDAKIAKLEAENKQLKQSNAKLLDQIQQLQKPNS